MSAETCHAIVSLELGNVQSTESDLPWAGHIAMRGCAYLLAIYHMGRPCQYFTLSCVGGGSGWLSSTNIVLSCYLIRKRGGLGLRAVYTPKHLDMYTFVLRV